MKKIIFSMLLISIHLHAIHHFREVKLIEALGIETYRYGSIQFSKQKTIIKYKDGKTITKEGDKLTIHDNNNKLLQTIELSKKPKIAIYFKLTKALFSKNFISLEKDFTIKKKNLKYTFKPKGDVKYVIKQMELQLAKNGAVIYFVIDFRNKDTIKIETL